MAFGFGGGSNKASSSSESASDAYGYDYSNTYIDPQQQGNQQFLNQQYQQNFNQLGRSPWQDRQRRSTMTDMSNIQDATGQFTNRVGQAAGFGMDQMQQFAQQGNPYLEQQISGLQQDAGRMFREEIMPGIGSGASMNGQRGSSRQGIAEGLAAGRTQDAFLQEAGNMRYNTYGLQQQAAGDLMGQSGIYNQGRGIQGSLANQRGQLSNQFAQTRQQGQAMPFEIGASVIGQPSILSQSGGENFATSRSSSKSKGKGSSANLGFG